MSRAKHMCALLGLALCANTLMHQADAHGMVIQPISRNFWAYSNPNAEWFEKEYNPTGMNGGGPIKTSNNRMWTWPKGQKLFCGEAFDASPVKYMKPAAKGYMPSKYRPGSIIEFHVLIHAHHLGRFSFKLCPQSFGRASQCQDLLRADGGGKVWYLPPPKNLQEDLSPLWEDGTFTWYRHPLNDDFRQQAVYVIKYKIPSKLTFSGSKAVVQWYWQTANTCTPSCVKADHNYPNCAEKANLPECGAKGSGYPEEFWNCVDIDLDCTS